MQYRITTSAWLCIFTTIIAINISGCYPLPIYSDQPEYSIQPALDDLIGSQKEEVLIKIGEPQQILATQNHSYFIYTGDGSDYELWMIGWMPFLPSKSVQHYCVILAFGDTGIMEHYNLHYMKEEELPYDWCEIYLRTQIAELASEDVLLAEAKKGNKSAQWALYKLRKSSGEYDFQWLCKAAEQGDYRAQWELGYIYYNGLYGVRKDLVMSVMWYNHLEYEGYDPKGVNNIRGQLTPEQLLEAEHLYKNWKPGQCEREISRIEPSDIK